ASARADHGPGGEDRDPPFGGEGRNERRCERHHEERSGQERGFLDKHGCLPIESEWFSVMRRGITEAQSPFPTLRDGPKLSESNRPTAESISGPAASLPILLDLQLCIAPCAPARAGCAAGRSARPGRERVRTGAAF